MRGAERLILFLLQFFFSTALFIFFSSTTIDWDSQRTYANSQEIFCQIVISIRMWLPTIGGKTKSSWKCSLAIDYFLISILEIASHVNQNANTSAIWDFFLFPIWNGRPKWMNEWMASHLSNFVRFSFLVDSKQISLIWLCPCAFLSVWIAIKWTK